MWSDPKLRVTFSTGAIEVKNELRTSSVVFASLYLSHSFSYQLNSDKV